MAQKNKKKTLFLLVVALIVVVACAVAGYLGYNFITDDISGNRGTDNTYHLEITAKDFEFEIGKKLRGNGIIKSDTVWTNWMRKHYPDFVYINGEYDMDSSMSYEDIAEKLRNPDISHKSVKVCIPEGTNCMQISKILEENEICSAQDFLDVCRSTDGFDYDWLSTIPDSDLIAFKLEGFLFPATYDLAQNSDPHDVADEMLDAFDLRITDDIIDFCRKNDMTLFELVTLASIVQEEALGANSGGKIASVFLNRLENGTKLQSDVTYFYARDLRDDYGFSQEVYDSYYTYRCEGLPSGPITNSGADIIAATVDHPDTDYMYFYSDLQQQFHFAKTYDEFMAQQKKYPWK